jgi:hypothetical protein
MLTALPQTNHDPEEFTRNSPGIHQEFTRNSPIGVYFALAGHP